MSARGQGSYYQGYKWCRTDKRWTIYWRDRNRVTDELRCLWCGISASVQDVYAGKLRLSLDHLVPWSSDGSNEPENLVTCCLKCNEKRGDKTFEQTALGDLFEPYAYMRIKICVKLPLDRSKGRELAAARPKNQWRKPPLVCARECATRIPIEVDPPDENGMYEDGSYAA